MRPKEISEEILKLRADASVLQAQCDALHARAEWLASEYPTGPESSREEVSPSGHWSGSLWSDCMVARVAPAPFHQTARVG